MDEVREMFLKLQNDITSTKSSIKDMETNITKNINNNMIEIVKNLQSKIEILEEENASQENRIDRIERTQRQRNIIIFGVDEKERGYDDLTQIVLKILNDIMKVNCTIFEIQALRRVGRKGDRIRPIAISFTTLGRKIEVQKKWKTLKNSNSNYSISEDYPPKILAKRKTLMEQANIEKEKGNKVLIKYDKLIILPSNQMEIKSQSRNTKRALSQTPPQTNMKNETNAEKKSQAQKKNKLSSYWAPSRFTKVVQSEHCADTADDNTIDTRTKEKQ